MELGMLTELMWKRMALDLMVMAGCASFLLAATWLLVQFSGRSRGRMHS